MPEDVSWTFFTAAGGGLAGAWAFAEGAGTTTLDDSGNGNTGVLEGPSWSSGALSFDGVNDRVRVNGSDTLNIIGPITLAAWVKLTSYKDWAVILLKQSDSGDHSYALWLNPNHKLSANFVLDGTARVVTAPSTGQSACAAVTTVIDVSEFEVIAASVPPNATWVAPAK